MIHQLAIRSVVLATLILLLAGNALGEDTCGDPVHHSQGVIVRARRLPSGLVVVSYDASATVSLGATEFAVWARNLEPFGQPWIHQFGSEDPVDPGEVAFSGVPDCFCFRVTATDCEPVNECETNSSGDPIEILGLGLSGNVFPCIGTPSVCGNSTKEGAENCDDGNTENRDCCSSTCTFESLGTICDAGDACSDPSTCDGLGTCVPGAFAPLGTICRAAGACSDPSTCDGLGTCIPGAFAPPGTLCNDRNACTAPDTCDDAGRCNPGPLVICNNGLFCDGFEFCKPPRGCQSGTPPRLDDGIACTVDSCDEVNDRVVHTPVDALCDNGLFCDGLERCDPIRGCEATAPATPWVEEDFEVYLVQRDTVGVPLPDGATAFAVTTSGDAIVATVSGAGASSTGIIEEGGHRFWVLESVGANSQGLLLTGDLPFAPGTPRTPENAAGPFAEFFSVPRDLSADPELRICMDIRESSSSGRARVRFLLRDQDGNEVTTSRSVLLTDSLQTIEAKVSVDFDNLLGPELVDLTRVQLLGVQVLGEADSASKVVVYIDDIRLAPQPAPGTADADADAIADHLDNCVAVPNEEQQDIDAGQDDDSSEPGIQHYGDACDADLDNDGIVGATDFFGIFLPCLGQTPAEGDPCKRADLDGDGAVGASDFFGVLRPALGRRPGPGVTEVR